MAQNSSHLLSKWASCAGFIKARLCTLLNSHLPCAFLLSSTRSSFGLSFLVAPVFEKHVASEGSERGEGKYQSRERLTCARLEIQQILLGIYEEGKNSNDQSERGKG
ncbi:hypothetical protein POVCU2_0002800 [Plasmodium ovale curtisi]|uniref:Uncharacterized protein n=1 Tax=Plasmodium ovale curtisi TaxID=864141 RepID=A0A1A8VI36_PLAOA|nr:hypothetical protein POVCU2_0002800 [Plasmodium ovale curtisi]